MRSIKQTHQIASPFDIQQHQPVKSNQYTFQNARNTPAFQTYANTKVNGFAQNSSYIDKVNYINRDSPQYEGKVINQNLQGGRERVMTMNHQYDRNSSYLEKGGNKGYINNFLTSVDKNESRKEDTLSPISPHGRQTFSHNTVDELISKFQDSLTPLKLKNFKERDAVTTPFDQKEKNSRRSDQEIILEMQEKQKEIRRLRMQVERYQRCENINKEKQQIYQRLVKKMKKEFNNLKSETEEMRERQGNNQNMKEGTLTHLQTMRHHLKGESNGQLNRDTPFNLIKTDSKYVKEVDEWNINNDDQRHQIKGNIANGKHVQEKQLNFIPYNANKKIKQKGHHKIFIPKTTKTPINIQPCTRSSMALKLSEMNQKILTKKIDPFGDKNRIAKCTSFIEKNDYRTRIESAKNLSGYYL